MPTRSNKQVVIGSPASAPSASEGSRPSVVKCLDQHGQSWLRVSYHGGTATGSVADLLANESGFFAHLNRQGVLIVTLSARNHVKAEAERALATDQVYVVETSGWQGPHFIRAGEPIPAKLFGVSAIDARSNPKSSGAPRGSFDTWKSEVRRLANEQALPTFVLACALGPLLPRLVPELDDNPGFELFGDTTLGKSVLLKLGASVHGSPSDLVRHWNTTVNGLERPMAEANDSVLLLDEISEYLEGGGPDRRHTLARAMFKLAHGIEKERHDRPAARYRFAFLSSTNVALADVMCGLPPAEAEAIGVRVATIPAAASRYGVFDRLPPGCSTSKAAADEVVRVATEHHGHAARAFTAELERRLATPIGRALLKRRMVRNLNTFRCRAGLASAEDKAAARAGDKFALAYVAAHFARRWGILPLDHVGSRILEVYRRQAAPPKPASAPRTAAEQVQHYVTRWRPKLVDLREGAFPDLDKAALDAAPGFLASRHGNSLYLMLRKAQWDAAFGDAGLVMLRELKAAGRLWTNAGPLQCQAKLRANMPKDRVYAVRLDQT
ncbi:DUF927 domain-containing protein [Methylorubrum extorquens]|uniref:DUF927 domain-containing protein n=1 Tax=Methylorubrum extorquens (strain ATCC 14718 / DSM 1338 / JCM 2805 / NCIMB 9133 / AM1) TaxID=272630 RepID=C5APF5_METEA|nr:DUF927 domain-containing protein [Methylorubrum extorquens]ACS38040.1 hypothetical protein MexAM1_META1p0072 [Methylorubrum extorquens AM1]MCP1543917.1 hypothetical protein [Methylorubrum extorquens]MCP1588737.1 hypothetical protein [Methylorubrum extorquens]